MREKVQFPQPATTDKSDGGSQPEGTPNTLKRIKHCSHTRTMSTTIQSYHPPRDPTVLFQALRVVPQPPHVPRKFLTVCRQLLTSFSSLPSNVPPPRQLLTKVYLQPGAGG